MKKVYVLSAFLVIGLFALSVGVAHAWPWSSTYTVNTYVHPTTSLGYGAWVTLYGNNGYYGHKQLDWSLPNYVSFYSVPGGSSVYNRIDVDRYDGVHREYYNQHIYNALSGTVTFTYYP